MEKYLVIYEDYKKMLEGHRKETMKLLRSIDDDDTSEEARGISSELMGLASHINTCMRITDLNIERIKRDIKKKA